MHEPLAIRLENVSKIYKLHGSQRDQLIDILGLQRFGIKTKTSAKEFVALSGISLDVPRGHRIGIVGRNGAGKTTLLKLLCGNFAPTFGEIEVNGTVQALMNIGLGFHPEFTGRENVEASLQYNGLARDEYRQAMDEVVEFCELGDFLDQPFKTYSLGMQARLMFASATAIRPDILIVDEMLGSGDAYFVAKSKTRVERIVNSGCTMLLVSHSMQQVLELCDEAIWLDQGIVRMRGPAFEVVKAYEAYLHGPILDLTKKKHSIELPMPKRETERVEKKGLQRQDEQSRTLRLQEPVFLPHAHDPVMPDAPDLQEFSFVAPGGLSRWEGSGDLQFTGFSIVGENGVSNILASLRPAKIILQLQAQCSGDYSCRYTVNISNHLGQTVCSIKSPEDSFHLNSEEYRRVELLFNPLQIGPGEYTIGVALLDYGVLETVNLATRHDLLSRSFEMKVENPDSWSNLQNQFFHSAEWNFK
jgi:lipopolysaccharide transport system ATP-binding protein